MSDVEFSHPFDTSALGAEPQRLVTHPTMPARAWLSVSGLVSLERLSASGIRRVRGHEGVIEIRGHLDAAAEQACRVTLDPVPEAISEEILVTVRTRGDLTDSAEIELDALSEEPEPFEGTILDIGEIVASPSPVALDPFPRSDAEEGNGDSETVYSFGEDEDAPDGDADPAPEHPFAGLAALKQTMKSEK